MSKRLTYSLAVLCSAAHIGATWADQPAFQLFMRDACVAAAGALDVRCTESSEGELSGDSEDSLIPTQSLSNTANALAQTRARIAAALARQEALPGQEENRVIIDEPSGTRRITRVFGTQGLSVLFQAEYGMLERDASLLERGYQTESFGARAGVDYRVNDATVVGVLLGYDRYDQVFDTDAPGTNFTPQGNEGDSEASTWSLNLFGSTDIGERGYLEGLVSYGWADYRFQRNVVFQETNRAVPQTNVNTSADSEGTQLVMSVGGGYEWLQGKTTLGTYGRLDHTEADIEGYTEGGGNGLAMRFGSQSNSETLGTLGIRGSHALNHSFGVIVPQGFVEYVHAFEADPRTTVSSFVGDAANTTFVVSGDRPDSDYLNAGLNVLLILPDGISAYLGYSRRLEDSLVDYYRVNGGLRLEF